MKMEKASVGDAGEILQLQKLAYRREAERYNDFGIDPLVQTLEHLQSQFENHVVLKAVLDDSIVGSVRAYEQDGTCFVGKLMVHPDHQNLGIGKMLMSSIEDSFPHSRYELFTGSMSESNIAFYQKLGYKTFKEKEISGITFVYFEKQRG